MSKQFETVARWLDKLHYVETPERTCENTSDSNYFCCSVCRKKTYRGDETFNYCPNCSAKVVGE